MEEVNLARHPELSTSHSVGATNLRKCPPGHFSSWHPAPKCQHMVSLSGIIEIGSADDTKAALVQEVPDYGRHNG